jgi:hypothetical protein
MSAKESIGNCDAKHDKQWFYEECSELFDRRKQAKVKSLQDPSEVNEDNLINVRRKASKQSRKKKREYLKDKIDELELNSKNRISDACVGT